MGLETKKRMSKPVKIILWIVGGIVGLFIFFAILGSLIGTDDEPAGNAATPSSTPSASASDAPSSTPTTARSEAAEVSEPEASPEVAAPEASGREYADSVYNAWLSSRGVASNTDILLQSPESVQGYLVSAESPTTGTVVFTAQLAKGDVTKAELEQAAMAVLQLVGVTDESLDRVEVVTADSVVRGVANRRDSLLLNQ